MALRSLGCLCILLLVVCADAAHAATVTLAWDPSTSSNVAGYTVKYGTKLGSYQNVIDAGNTTSFTIASLPNGTYYFVVQAYASDGTKSPHSEYLMVTIGLTAPSTPPPPVTTPGGCSTPDPFLALGGGTCYNGAWLPPGMVPGGSPSPAPAPAPAPPPPPAPAPSAGGCTTPDPFATLGGGVCYNGGWLPPGMTPPSSSPAPAPQPVTPPTPPPTAPPPPPSSGGTCSTPDPFAALGGGTCYNGAWLPPGMAPPTTTPSKPSPGAAPPPVPSPSAPVAPPTNVTCTIADPFASMGGGTCYNGGWLPPGMPVPGGGTTPPPAPPSPSNPSTPMPSTDCATPDPFVVLGGGTCYNGAWLPPGMVPPDETDDEITVTGTLHVLDAELGVWLIEAEDGTLYTSTSEIPEEIFVAGTIVTFRGIRLPAESEDQEIVVVEILEIDIQP